LAQASSSFVMAPPLVPNERLELARAIASTARDLPSVVASKPW